ncbi:hypothetical protein CBS63078_11045 [Aspergillus niger]|nr:hypothetical protein CBS63078_11045 [Aspergillus niger]
MQEFRPGKDDLKDGSRDVWNPPELDLNDLLSDSLDSSNYDGNTIDDLSDGSGISVSSDWALDSDQGYEPLRTDSVTEEESNRGVIVDRISNELTVLGERVVQNCGRQTRHCLVIGWVIKENLDLFKDLAMRR